MEGEGQNAEMGPSADEVNNNTCAGNRILRVNGHVLCVFACVCMYVSVCLCVVSFLAQQTYISMKIHNKDFKSNHFR